MKGRTLTPDIMLDHASDVVTVIGGDGRFLYGSASVERVLGYGSGELTGKNIVDYLHPDDVSYGTKTFEVLRRRPGVTPPLELRWRHRDGTWRWLESVGNNLLEDPSVGAIIYVSRDVTGRRESPAPGERSGSSLVENFPGVSYLIGPDPDEVAALRFEYVSPNSREILGYPPEAFYGDRELSKEIIHPDDRENVLRSYEPEPDSQGRTTALECRTIHPEKGLRWVRVQASVFGTPESGGTYVHGVLTDITDRRLKAERLTESEQSFKSAFENSSAGMAMTSVDLELLQVNRSLCRMLGYEESELLGKRMEQITHPEDIGVSRDRARQLLAGEKTSMTIEKRYFRRDGSILWAISSSAIVRNSAGEPTHFVISYQDITRRKETERRLAESEERFRALVHKSSETVKIVELDGTIRYASPAFERDYGYPLEDVVGMNVLDLVHPEDLETLRRATGEAIGEHNRSPGDHIANVAEYRFRHADGSWRYVESIGTYLLDHPAVRGVVVNTRDITRRKQTEERLSASETRYRKVVESVRDVIFQIDHAGRFCYLNPAWERVMGYTTHETIGRRIRDFVDDREGIFSDEDTDCARLVQHLRSNNGEVIMKTSGGEKRYFEVRIEEDDESGDTCSGLLYDVTERRLLESRLEHQATHDPLTDLPNRRLLVQRLGNALDHPEDGSGIAVLFLDLDRFKQINDSYGHEVGDRVLVSVARRLEGCLRKGDTIARLGGEEFVVLLERTDLDTATGVGQRMMQTFCSEVTPGGGEDRIKVSASIGIAFHADRRTSAEGILRDADNAMYRAKENGRNRVEVFVSGAGHPSSNGRIRT